MVSYGKIQNTFPQPLLQPNVQSLCSICFRWPPATLRFSAATAVASTGDRAASPRGPRRSRFRWVRTFYSNIYWLMLLLIKLMLSIKLANQNEANKSNCNSNCAQIGYLGIAWLGTIRVSGAASYFIRSERCGVAMPAVHRKGNIQIEGNADK